VRKWRTGCSENGFLNGIFDDDSNENNDFEVNLDQDGQVSITLNGKNIKRFQSPWPMPVQPGNINYLTGNWDIGTAGSKWFTPIGDYRKEHEYSGKIYQVQIQILN
jgi:hypothetical protein